MEVTSVCRGLVLAVLAALLLGCTTVEFNAASDAPSLAPYRGEVKVLRQLPAAGPYRRIGVVLVRGVRITEADSMLEDMKEAAAKRGADTVVLQGKLRSRETGGGEDKTLAAWAIRVAP